MKGIKMKFMVQHRENAGKGFNRRLRKEGLTPGIIYGKEEPQKVSMRADQAFRLIQSMKGTKKVIELNLKFKEETTKKNVVMQDYQLSNVGNKLLHVDFLEVTDDTTLSINVPIKAVNEDVCPAIKTGGVLQTIRRAVPIRCKVKDIPEFISVDLIDLHFGNSIHVLDLDYPEGVSPVVTGRNFTVITVVGRISEEEEAVEEVEEVEVSAGEETKEVAEDTSE